MAEQQKDESKRREHVAEHRGTSVRAALHHKDEESLLARWYKDFLTAVKQPPSKSTWLLLVVVLLAAVLIGSWFWFTSSSNASSSELWLKKFQTPPTPADLEKFAEDPSQKASVQARFALVESARRRMAAVADLGSDARAKAAPEITKAKDIYEELVRDSGDTPALMQESLFGAAKANEALGDLAKARQFYAQLAKDYKDTVLGREADARIKALDEDAAKKDMQALSVQPK